MEIRHQYFEEEKLLVQKFTGIFSFEQYKRNAGKIYQEYKSKEIKKVLIDFRDIKITNVEEGVPVNFDEKLDKMVNYRKELIKTEQLNKNVLLVIWVDTPLPTVIAHLFVSRFSNMDYNYCTTESKVIEIMELKDDFNLSHKLNNLNHLLPIS